MIEYIGFFVFSVLCYLFFYFVLVNVFKVGPGQGPLVDPELVKKNQEKANQQSKQEIFQDELQKEKKAGVGFKQLKSQASKSGKKKGKSQQNNPENEHYVSAIKGFTSAVADFDWFAFPDGGLLFVVGEEVRFRWK